MHRSNVNLLSRFITVTSFFAFVFLGSMAHAQEEHELEKAFYKEYTFLQKEKKALENRLKTLQAENKKAKRDLKEELEQYQQSAFEAEMEIEHLNEKIVTIDKEALAKESSQTVFEATLDQANATLHPDGSDKADSIEQVIQESLALLNKNASITSAEGSFYLQDGTQVSGEIVHLGGIARFGLTDSIIGPLAPAGGGEFMLWKEAKAPSNIKDLASGQMPETLELFIFDSPTKEVQVVEEKDIYTTIDSGGIIAWIIVTLGVIATLLAIFRGMFLFNLGKVSSETVSEISNNIQAGKLEDAKTLAEGCNGSVKRVLTSTLNNIKRDREHVEDAISEAILHEHTALDRFHSLIMVIAAISPLLGLLGTVTGMIETFDVITEFGTGDPKLLSGGISIALVTTELGLIVAIPVLVVGTILGSWSNKIKDTLEKSALHIVNQYQNTQGR
ncbi:MotA/TolQ/ExbB proton channel family protein [Thiomicrospira sp. WB1]|uniref:MotA/TolQ/ExbB proton channel family protein n=1 Tax=Thiomicrospira sp. WB1 TaxID=1685380 RepID=UPI0007471BCA|nr:MotA/TolQ/ExbB proton channel family protein [Thiomicrospira sp. WB1]KUJ72442.1 hypothetical protein AVO41_01105 [Thiomicrospira sp. WB1]